MRALDLYKQIAGDKKPAISSTLQRALQDSRAAKSSIGQANSDPTVTADPAVMQTKFSSGTENFWNSLMNSIDEIHKSTAQGKQLTYQRDVDKLTKQAEELQADPRLQYGSEEQQKEAQQKLQEIESNLKDIYSNEDYIGLKQTEQENQDDIDESPIDKDYQLQQDYALGEENTDFFKYVRYELPKELGGNLSEMGTQLGVALGEQGLSKLGTMAASSAIGGPLAPFIAAAMGVASLGAGLYSLYHMRENESDAEVNDAFNQNIQLKQQELQSQLGRELTESEIRDIRLEAYEGLDQLKAQNMNLVLGDALDTILLALPWAKNIARLTGGSLGTRLAKNAFGGIAGAYSEGMEETDQYGAVQQYLAGKYKDNKDFNILDTIKESANLRKDSFDYAVTGESGENYEKDPEYRNAFRSGAILGGVMGGASSVGSAIGDVRDYNATARDIKTMSPSLIDKEKIGYRADLYSKYFGNDKGHLLLEGLEDLSNTLTEPEHLASLKEEIRETKKAGELYDTVTRNNPNLAKKEINAAYGHIYELKGLMDNYKQGDSKNEAKYADELVKLNSLVNNPVVEEAVRQKAKLDAIQNRLDTYYAMDTAPSNIKDYESQLEGLYKTSLEGYNNYLSANNLSDKQVNYIGLNDISKNESIRMDNKFVLSDLQKSLDVIHEKDGIKKYLSGKATATAPVTNKFDIESADLAGYEDYERRNLSRRKFKTKLDNFKNGVQRKSLMDKLDTTDINDILDEVNNELPSLDDDSISKLSKKIDERKQKIQEDEDNVGVLESESQMRDLTDEENDFLAKQQTTDHTPFLTNADKFDKQKSSLREQKSESDDATRRSIAEDFFKGTHAVIDNFTKNPDYAKIGEVKKQLNVLRKLKEIKSQRADLMTKAEFNGFEAQIDANISELESIQKEVEQRLQDISKKDATTFDTQSELVIHQLGTPTIYAKIKSIIGEARFNEIVNNAKESNLVYLGVDIIKYLLSNHTKKDELATLIEEERADIYQQLLNIKRIKSQNEGSGILEKYKKNPEGAFHSIITSLSSNEYDTTRESPIHKYKKDRNLVEFLANAKLDERIGKTTDKETLVNTIETHMKYLGLTNLLKSLDSKYNVEGEVEAELGVIKDVAANKSLFTPSNQQLVSIRQLVEFYHTLQNSNDWFKNVAYLKGVAGTGKTTVVLPWVMRLLGISKDNVLSAGHNSYSGETIGKALDTMPRNIQALMQDYADNVPENYKVVVVDEIGALTEAELEQLRDWFSTVNSNRKSKLKMIVLGDPNQVVAKGFFAPIEIIGSVWGLENLTHVSPLTTPYRSNVSAIVDVQDLFIDQPNNITNTPIHVQSNTTSPQTFTQDLLGVNGGDFDANIIPILSSRPDDNRSRAIIVGNENDVAKYEEMLASAEIKNVEVLTYIQAQGRTIDEVYANIVKDKTFPDERQYNTALYTALSRATKYIYIGSVPVNNGLSSNIEDNAKAREKSISDNTKKFTDNRGIESNFLSEHLDTEIAKEPKVEKPVYVQEEVPSQDEVEDEFEDIETLLEDTKELNKQEGNVGTTTNNPDTIKESDSFHNVQYPTYKSLASKNKDGIQAGDRVLYVKTQSKAGQPRIQMVAEVADKPGYFREVGILSEDELNNPTSGTEEIFSKLKSVYYDAQSEIDSFDESDGLLVPRESLSVLAEGRVATAQRLKYNYKKKGRPLNLRNAVAKFISSYFKGNAKDEEGIYRNAKVRVYSRIEVAKIEEESKGDFTPIAGIPYIELSGLEQTNGFGSAKQYIRLSPAKLNRNKHSTLVEPIQDFVDKMDLFTNLLTESGVEVNQALLAKLVRSTDEEAEKLLAKVGYGGSLEALHTIRKEIDDLVYDKVPYEKDGETKYRREDGKAQRAFNIIAKSNLEADGKVLRGFRSYNETKDGKVSVIERFGGKRLLPEKDTPYTDQIVRQYAARILKQKGLEPSIENMVAMSEQEKSDIVKAVTESMDLNDLKSLLSFDDKGNSTAKNGFGLRVPLYKSKFPASGSKVELGDYIEDTFESVSPTSITIGFSKSARTEKSEQKTEEPNVNTGSNISDEQVNQVDDLLDTLFLLQDGSEDLGTFLTSKEARAYAKELLPTMTNEELKIVEEVDLMRISKGKKVWGLYKKGLIYLSQNKGLIQSKVIRHEVFHRVFNFHLTNAERAKLMEIAVRDYPQLKGKSMGQVDEFLARKYQDWEQKKTSISIALLNFFKKIAAKLGFVTTNIKTLDKLFNDIDNGLFRKASSEPLNVGRTLIKITKHYGDTRTYVKAKEFAIRTLSIFLHNEATINDLGDNLAATAPVTFKEAVEKLQTIVDESLKKVKAAMEKQDSDKLRAQYSMLSALAQRDKKNRHFVIKELMEDVYPNIFNSKWFTETISDFEEAVEDNENIEASEHRGISDHTDDADRKDHEKSISGKVKDLLSTIVTSDNKIVNPRFAYFKLLQTIPGLDFSDFNKLDKQLADAFGEQRNSNVNVKAIYERIQKLIRNSSPTITFKKRPLRSDMEFINEDTIRTNEGFEIKRKGDSSAVYFARIKKELEKRNIVVEFQELKYLFEKKRAQETLAAIRSSIGSLREKHVMIAEQHNTKKLKSEDGVKEVFVTTYRYISLSDTGVRRAIDSDIREAITNNYGKVNSIMNMIESAKTKEERKTVIREFLNTIGIKDVVDIPSNVITGTYEAIQALVKNFETIGTKVGTDVNEEGNEEDVEYSIEDVLSDSNQRIETLTNLLLANTQDVRASSYRAADGKKRYLFMNSSNAMDTLLSMTTPHLEANKPKFLQSPFFKNNIFVNGINKLIRYVDHDGIKDADDRRDAILYKNETEQDWYVRNINFAFASMIKNASQSKGLKYIQNFYTNSNKPDAKGMEVNVLNPEQLRKAIGSAIDQENDREDADIASYDKSKRFFESTTDKMIEKLERIADELTDRLIEMKFPVDFEIGSIYANLKKEGHLDSKFKDAELPATIRHKNKGEYNVQKEHILPLIDTFVKNYYVNGHFLNQLVMGDQAFYKSSEDEIKRMSIAFGVGYTGLVNANGWMRPKFRMVVAEDLQGTLGAYFDKFNKINPRFFDSTDAAGFITPERAEELRRGFSADMNLGVSMKPVYFGIDENGIPRAVKYSTIELTDELVKNFPKLGILRDDMRKNNVDEYTFKSAFKVGAPNILSQHDEETGERLPIDPNSIVELSNSNYRIQLNPVHSIDSQVANPTQLTYFINFNGMNKVAGDLLYNLNAKLIRHGLMNIKDVFKVGTSEELGAIRRKISSSMGDTDARQKEFLDEKGISLNFPVLVNKVITQLSSVISKSTVAIKYPGSKLVLQPDYGVEVEIDGIKRRIRFRDDVKMPDGSVREYAEVIMPNMYREHFKEGDTLFNTTLGFRVPSTELHSAIPLKVVGFYDSKGSNVIIAPQEIVLFHGSDYDIDSLFIMRRQEWLKDDVPGYTMKGGIIGYKDGKFQDDFIDRVAASMDELRKKLANASQKEQKAVYKTLKAEYDTMSDIYEKAIKNRIVDIFLDVITDPKNKELMMTPITTGRIDDTKGRYGESVFEMIQRLTGKLKIKRDLNDPRDQAAIHYANHSGTALVGGNADAVKALAYIFQSVTDDKLPDIKKDYHIELNGVKYDHLSRVEYADREDDGDHAKMGAPIPLQIEVGKDKDGKPIMHSPLVSETMDALINAAVDNVKLQILAIINMTNNTGKAWVAMIGMGIPLKTVTKFMITPAIKQISTIKGVDRGIKTATLNIKEKISKLVEEGFNIDEASNIIVTDEIMDSIISKDAKGEELTREELLAQYRIIKQFETANKLGEKINNFSSASKVTQTLPVTYEDIQDKLGVFEDIDSDSGFENVDIMKVPHIKESHGILSFLADKVRSIVYKHNENLVKFSMEIAALSNINLEKKGNKNARAIRDEFVKYVMSSISYIADGERYSFSTINEAPYEVRGKKYRAVGTDAWNQRFIDEVSIIKKSNPNNDFLRNLEINTNYRTGLKYLRYSAAGTAKQEDILDYQEAFKALHDGIGYSQLQHDFVKYAALNFGLSFGSSNYSLLLPPDIYKGMSNELDKKFNRLLEGSQEEIKAKLDNLNNHFALQMSINNVDKVAFNTSNEKLGDRDYGIEDVGSTRVRFGLRYAAEKDGKPVDLPFIIKSYKKVYVKIPNVLSDKQKFVYYQEIGKQPSNTYYQLDNRVLYFGYDYTKAFRPDILVRTLDNNLVEEYVANSKLDIGVGDTLALRNYSDITRMDMIDYKITEEIENEDGTFTYKLGSPKRVFEVNEGNMPAEEFIESSTFKNKPC